MKKDLCLKPVFLAAILVLPACQQYLDRSDRISMSAGDAHAVNETSMVVDPWPPYLDETDFDTDGQRMSSAIDSYRTKPAPQPATTSVAITPSSN